MSNLEGKIILVAGGTGVVGSGIVNALLERGATVVVPSRYEVRYIVGLLLIWCCGCEGCWVIIVYSLLISTRYPQSIELLLASVTAKKDKLFTIEGNIGDEEGAETLKKTIVDKFTAGIDHLVSSLGLY